MAFDSSREDQNIFVRFGSVAHRPPDGVHVSGIDIFIHRDYELAHAMLKVRNAVQGSPHFVLSRFFHLHDDQFSEIGQRLVHRDFDHAFQTEIVAQMIEIVSLEPGLSTGAGFIGSHLAHEGRVDGVFFHGNGRDFHDRRERSRMNVAVGLAERTLGLEVGSQ